MSKFQLPTEQFNNCKDTECYIRPCKSERYFGPFQEKILVCNQNAKNAIDNICDEYGFCNTWEDNEEIENLFNIVKIPVLILIKIMIGTKDENIINKLTGAYPITMKPENVTCVNVIVERRQNEDKSFSIDKFSLYYPNNHLAYSIYGKEWPILNGYSFRTAIFNGNLNRDALNSLRYDRLNPINNITFKKELYGLKIDDDSEYEDCGYMEGVTGETKEKLLERIKKMVDNIVKSYKSTEFIESIQGYQEGVLALSYDVEERKNNITAIESELKLFLKYANKET